MITETPERTVDTLAGDRTPEEKAQRRERAQSTLWKALALVFAKKRFVLLACVVTAIVAAAISLVLPKWYLGRATVILPDSSGGGGGLTSILADLSPGTMSLLGGGGGDYTRFRALLRTRGVFEAVVDEFNLASVYELEESPTARLDAVDLLRAKSEFTLDLEDDFLAIEVLDQDPQRSADMANFFVDELNRMHIKLSSEHASSMREFVELQFSESMTELDSIRARFQDFQQEHGVIELQSQLEANMYVMAQAKAEEMAAAVQLGASRREVGESNPHVQALKSLQRQSRFEMRNLLSGENEILPVPRENVPEVTREYAEIKMDLLLAEKIMEFTAPLVQNARFEEKRESPGVQVLDPAIPPVLKSKPQRSVIVLASTLSAFFLSLLYLFARNWWVDNRAFVVNRLNEEAPQF